MAGILDHAPAIPKQPCITSNAFTGPLQRYMLPQLTLDVLILLRTTCKALHQLVITAPFQALQQTLQTLLPPGVRHCATDSCSMGALVRSQIALQRCLEAGAAAQLQRLLVSDIKNFWGYRLKQASRPLWVLESPCRRLILECNSIEPDESGQVLMDPCDLLASQKNPAARMFSQEKSPFVSFLKTGALVRAGSSLGLLDLQTQEQTRLWECPGHSFSCEAGPDSGLICVIVSETNNSWHCKIKCVAVLDPSSLQELFMVGFPMGPGPAATVASSPTATATCRWMQPSPDQQHVAVYWNETANCRRSHLCIYALPDAELEAEINFQVVFGPSVTQPYQAQWSPDSFHILFPADQGCNSNHLPSPGVIMADVSGSYQMLAASANWPQHTASWSADGQYVLMSGSRPSSAEREHQSCNSVWRAETGEELLAWKDPINTCQAAWSPVGSAIFLPDLTLVILPAAGISTDIIRHRCHGPKCLRTSRHGSGFAFSPSGSTLVGAWQKSVICVASQLPQELWHAHCSPAGSWRRMTPVAMNTSGWVMETIQWNPSPGAAHIYAIMTGGGSVHLIDAEQHQCLRIWSRLELTGSASPGHLDPSELSWSPDGGQLLAFGNGCISLLTFDPAAANAPQSA